MAANDHDPVTRIVAFYQNLRPADVDRIAELYAEDAYFRDPFNEVRGTAAIAAIFRRMFADLDACRFSITEVVCDEGGAFLIWDFTFRIRRFRPQRLQSIHGASHLRFDPAGRVLWHRD